jgi:hypothetical protein
MGFSSSKIDIYSSYQGRQNLINKSTGWSKKKFMNRSRGKVFEKF